MRVTALDGSGGRGVAAGLCPANRGGAHALALSPDGRRLAFVCSYATGGSPPWRTGVYVLELASGPPRRVADEAMDGWRGVAWSPDGRRLAYFRLVDLGPAAVGAGELGIYDSATGQTTPLDQGRHFVGAPVWTPDGAAVVYRVGSWENGPPVVTYRAPLDGSGGVPWRPGVHALHPGPDGRWLGSREPRDVDSPGEVVAVAADGALAPLTAAGLVERPLGWLGADPVVWRETAPASRHGPGRGDVWRLGSTRGRLLQDVPDPDHDQGRGPTAALVGGRLLYVDRGTAWLAELATGRTVRVAEGVQPPVALIVGA